MVLLKGEVVRGLCQTEEGKVEESVGSLKNKEGNCDNIFLN